MASKSLAPLLLAALLFGSGTTMAAPESGALFCCNRICGDTVPDSCRGKSYRVYDRAGNLIREVAAPLTPEEKKAKAIAEQQEKELEAQRLEQRRKDQALLNTYTSLEDIDRAQAKAEEDVRDAIKVTEGKLEELRKRRVKIDNELEFYRKATPPAELQKSLRENEHEQKITRDLLDAKRKEFDAIRGKFDADRQRYRQLTGRTN